MTPAPLSSRSRINLAGASVLLVEATHQGMGVLSQIFIGFGVRDAHRARDAEQALEVARTNGLDLIVAEATLTGAADGYDLVRELRRARGNPNAFTPVILVSGHTQLSKVRKARDCGANFIIAKPLTPKVVLERVVWVAQEARPYVETAEYLGPDRRFHLLGPPAGQNERRSAEPDDATGDARR